MANLRFNVKEKKKLLAHVNAMSELFEERMSQMKFKQRVAVRVKRLAIAVELKDSSYAEKVASRCQESGLLLTMQENALTMFLPLNFARDAAEEGLDILARCA